MQIHRAFGLVRYDNSHLSHATGLYDRPHLTDVALARPWIADEEDPCSRGRKFEFAHTVGVRHHEEIFVTDTDIGTTLAFKPGGWSSIRVDGPYP